MTLTVDDVKVMTVAKLRIELIARGIDVKGVKAVLVDKLLEALALESSTNGASTDKPAISTAGDEDGAEDEVPSQPQPAAGQESPRRATRGQALPESPKKTPGSPTKLAPAPAVVATPPTSPVKPIASPQKAAPVSPVKAVAPTPPLSSPVAPVVSPVRVTPPVAAAVVVSPTPASPKPSVGSPAQPVTAPVAKSASPVAISAAAPVAISTAATVAVSTPVGAVSPAKPIVTTEGKEESESNEVEIKSSEDVIDSAQSEPSQVKSESMEVDAEADPVVSSSQGDQASESQPEQMEAEAVPESLKRKREENGGHAETKNQKKGNVKKLRTEEDYKARILPDDEPEYDDTLVLLDWYKSDLNLKISKEGFLKAEPIIFEDFPWAYAGAKATHGFTSGKLGFEVKWLENSEVKFDFGKVEVKHILRLGWSDLYTDFQLGEEKFSYGYDSQGQFFNGGETLDIEDAKFEKGDVLATYLNLESDPIEISFTKNGVAVASTIQIPKAEVEGKIWFPHILARNTSFEVNFGASEPAHPTLESFQFVSKIESGETKVAGPARPGNKSECDFLMLCGMASSGKTKWAKEYKSKNLEKHINILGTSTVAERALKKTTLGGADTPKSYNSFLMKAGRFVERLVDMAPARRRNYVLDQSNVLPNVQRRKAAGFEGFKRRAVVILPNDEEYQTRIKAREQEQGKSVPKSTLLDMKATFRLPEVGETFSEVEFPELSKEEAGELVKKYNKEGLDAGYGQRNLSVRGGHYRGGRGGQRPPRGGGGGFFRGGRSGGGGGWRGGPPPPRGGGFRGMPRGMGGPPPRALRDGSRGGGFPSRGPPQGLSRGIPSLIGTRRNEAPRGMPGPRGGGGSWGRGAPSNGFQRGGRGGGGGGGYSGFRGSPGGGMGGGGRYNAPVNMGMGGGRPQQQQSPWASQPRSGGWGRGGGNSSYGGNQFGSQYTDPWAQQVPDQGYGQSWDNSGAVPRGGGGGGGGGTWQGYGGQTYGGDGYGRK